MPECNVSIFNLVKRTDKIEAASLAHKVNELSFTMQLNIIDNSNIGTKELRRSRVTPEQ